MDWQNVEVEALRAVQDQILRPLLEAVFFSKEPEFGFFALPPHAKLAVNRDYQLLCERERIIQQRRALLARSRRSSGR